MDRHNYYFKQLLTELELDEGFDFADTAVKNVHKDHNLRGIVSGFEVFERSPTSMHVNIPNGVAFDERGRRIVRDDITPYDLDCSKDYQNVSTAVLTNGWSRWISIFAEYEKDLSVPRIDGTSATVYFLEKDSAKYFVVMGAAALIPTKPTIPVTDRVLLCDIHIVYGATVIDNSDISFARTENAFRITNGAVSINSRNPRDAIYEVLGLMGSYPAANVSFTGTESWNDGSGISATDVQAAINEVVADLATETAGGKGGADKIGIKAIAGSPFSIVNGSVYDAALALLDHINTHVNDTDDAHNASAISYIPVGEWYNTEPLVASNVNDAVDEILNSLSGVAINTGADLIGVRDRDEWASGQDNPASSLYNAINGIILDLSSLTDGSDGAIKIGARRYPTVDGSRLPLGTVRSQLDHLADIVDRTNTWAEVQTFSKEIVLVPSSPATPAVGSVFVNAASEDLYWKDSVGLRTVSREVVRDTFIRFATDNPFGIGGGLNSIFVPSMSASIQPEDRIAVSRLSAGTQRFSKIKLYVGLYVEFATSDDFDIRVLTQFYMSATNDPTALITAAAHTIEIRGAKSVGTAINVAATMSPDIDASFTHGYAKTSVNVYNAGTNTPYVGADAIGIASMQLALTND